MKIILVGGFLGAGKTTLLWETVRRLTERGSKVGLITNDQAPDLVDTALLSKCDSQVREVAGSCFCCNFDGFRDAARSLEAGGAELVIAEPVGSCTDLIATIVRPLQKLHPEYDTAPLSILIDPARILQTLMNTNSTLHDDAVYIMHKQLEEAEHILISKSDTLDRTDADRIQDFLRDTFPQTRVHQLSSISGEGIDAWLELVTASQSSAGGLQDIDYDRYAQGEAVLGWLNAVVRLSANREHAPRWQSVILELMNAIQERLQETESEVGHIKMLLSGGDSEVVANLTGLHDVVSIRSGDCPTEQQVTLTINARVQIAPKLVERVVRDSLIRICTNHGLVSRIETFHCLKPGRPVPTHRFTTQRISL